MIEPAQRAPRAIRGQPPTKLASMTNLVANPPRNEAAEIRQAAIYKNEYADQAAGPRRTVEANTRLAVPVP